MSGFLDHLFDPSSSGKKGRERIRYREKLRSLIQDAPPVRRLTPQDPTSLTFAAFARADGQSVPGIDLALELVGDTASADRFRAFKTEDSVRPIWRLDPITTEEQILETRAMGADAYTIDVGIHDQAMVQFLVEVGRDYGLPAILSCRTPEDLALGLLIQDGGILWLRDEVHTDGLFDLPTLAGRTLMYESTERLTLSPDWVCTVIQTLETIPLSEREPRSRLETKTQEPEHADDDNDSDYESEPL
ncbi:MAG: hypothetical protein H7249_03410 [Chitinophagaceae bacterium]|nr:hypothetical protein [Oligoflexus sp.]